MQRTVLSTLCFLALSATVSQLGAESSGKEWLEKWKTNNRQWRAYHLTSPVGEKLPVTKTLIADVLAPMGINVLIVEVNYGFQFASHPELGGRGLSKEQARELTGVCRKHGIRLIPLMNCLGHQSWGAKPGALLKTYPQFDETPSIPEDDKTIRASRQDATDKMLGGLFTGWSNGSGGESLLAALRQKNTADEGKTGDTARGIAATIRAGLKELVGPNNDSMVEAGIRDLIHAVDTQRMKKHLFYLAKDPLPYRKVNFTLPGHQKNTLHEADDYLAGKLESWGYRVEREGVRVQAMRRDSSKPKHLQYSPPMPEDPWYIAYNLYAEKKGRLHPEEIIIVFAHKDSQSWVDSPGANDNAIGTVGVLEMACILAKHTPERTIRFLFCNEEHKPWTSVTAAQNAKNRGDKIIAAFNIDGPGVKTREDTAAGKMTNVTLYTKPEGERLIELMSEVNVRYGIGLEQRAIKRPRPGDDDGSFVRAGYPATILNIGSWPYGDPNYHAEEDIPERCDVPNAAKTVQATLAAILTLDQEP